MSDTIKSAIVAQANTRTGGRLTNIPLAAGASISLPIAGNNFYFQLLTATVNARTRGGNAGVNDFSEYVQQEGAEGLATFDFLDLQNPNGFALVISVWIGFDSFIDRRILLGQQSQYNVAYMTYPQSGTEKIVNIVDLSGQEFVDQDGNSWLAISRVGIDLENLQASGGSTYLLQPTGAVNPASGAVTAVVPQQSKFYPASGDFTVRDAANLEMIISEIYLAIPAT